MCSKALLLASWQSVLIGWLLASHNSLAQTVRYVKPGGTGNASSWAAASSDLQAIINASAAGDQVWVAAGTYKPGGDANTDRTLSFNMKNGVAIYGGFQGVEQSLSERPASLTTSQPSSSILSGDIGTVDDANDNSLHIIVNTNLDNSAVLDGFVITAARIINAAGYPPNGDGGGMRNQTSSPTIRNCQFTNNVLDFSSGGGGMYNDGGSSPTLTNCVFANNKGQVGGAIYNSATSSLTLTTCTFSYNSSEGWPAISGGTLTLTNCSFNNNNGARASTPSNGGALAISTGSTVTNCLFVSNNAQGYGGAIYVTGNPTITNCTFRGNLASGFSGTGNSMAYGGALYIDVGSPVITNCSFSNNIAAARVSSAGGAIYNMGTPVFINCSFGTNQSYGTGGAIYNVRGVVYTNGQPMFVNGTSTFTNCIIWGNTPNNITNDTGGSAVLTYTDTQEATPGTGNLNADPLFVDAANDNLRLRACSPAVDQGDNSVQVGSVDVVNNPRRVRTIDMGAYEFQGTPLGLVAITQQPNALYSIPEGGTLTVSVSTTGSVTGYQWYKDGAAITGVASATTATLILTNLTVSNQGSYLVVVTGGCNSVTSSAFRLLVNTGMYTVKTGSWDDASVWSLNRLPVSSDKVQIKHVVTLPAGYIGHAAKVGFDVGQRLRFGQASRVRLNH